MDINGLNYIQAQFHKMLIQVYFINKKQPQAWDCTQLFKKELKTQAL